MGFLRVVEEQEMNIPQLQQVWPDVITGNETTALCPLAGCLREGEKIIVAPGQIALLINNGKPEDVIDTAGGYLYYPHLETDSRIREYAEALDGLIQAGVRIGGSEMLMYFNVEALLRLAAQVKQPPQPQQPQPMPPLPQRQGNQRIQNFCPKCGHNLQMARQRFQSVKFCPGCGAMLG